MKEEKFSFKTMLIHLLGGKTQKEYDDKTVIVDVSTNQNLVNKVHDLEKELNSAKESLNALESVLKTDNVGKLTILEPTKQIMLNMIDHVSYNDDGKKLYNEVKYSFDIINSDNNVDCVWPGVYDMYVNGEKHTFGQHKKAFDHINKLLSDKKTEYISIELTKKKLTK